MIRLSSLPLTILMMLAITACDDKQATAANDKAAQSAAGEAPRAGDELPAPEQRPVDPAVDPSATEPEGVFEGSVGEGEAEPPVDMHAQSDVPPPSRDVFADSACNFESWVGQKVNENALKETGRPYRILEPGAMMTMDHSPDRINVEHDGKNIVTRVWCG